MEAPMGRGGECISLSAETKADMIYPLAETGQDGWEARELQGRCPPGHLGQHPHCRTGQLL